MQISVEQLIYILGAVLTALTGAVAAMFRSLMNAQADRVKAITEDRDFWRTEYVKLRESSDETMITTRDGVALLKEMVTQLIRLQSGRG